jgi:hypothetical protein
MIGDNQLVGSQGEIKKVAEVRERRLGRWREEVLIEYRRRQVNRMIWQVEGAAFFVLPPFFIKCWSLKMGKCSGKMHPEVGG